MTRVKEALNLVYHGIKEREKPDLLCEVLEWLTTMCDDQAAITIAAKRADRLADELAAIDGPCKCELGRPCDHWKSEAGIILTAALRVPAAASPAAPLSHYEQELTVNWEATNARRHDLIAKKDAGLTEGEANELRDLQWLAGVKRELLSGPGPAAPQEDAGLQYFNDGHVDLGLGMVEFEEAAPTPSLPARDAAREWMNTHHASFKTNKEREDALVEIILRHLPAGTETVGEPSCWHCGVVLAYAPKLRCEDCPVECDTEGCEELGCADSAST